MSITSQYFACTSAQNVYFFAVVVSDELAFVVVVDDNEEYVDTNSPSKSLEAQPQVVMDCLCPY